MPRRVTPFPFGRWADTFHCESGHPLVLTPRESLVEQMSDDVALRFCGAAPLCRRRSPPCSGNDLTRANASNGPKSGLSATSTALT